MIGITQLKERNEDIINPYENFNRNISNLRETIEIFPRIINAFAIIYDFLIDELKNNPDKAEALRELSYKIHSCIDTSAKKYDSKNIVTSPALLGAAIGSIAGPVGGMSGAIAGIMEGMAQGIIAMINDSSNPQRARKLLEQKISEGNEHNLILKLCYVHQVTILEVYLRDTLISALEKDEDIFRNFIEKYPRITERRFRSNELFKIRKIIFDEYIENHVFHKIEKDTRAMYRSSFNIDILEYNQKSAIIRIVKKRHDIIHRNSIDKDGKEIAVRKADLNKSLDTIQDFVNFIERSLIEKGFR